MTFRVLLYGLLFFSFSFVKSQSTQKQLDIALSFYENFHQKKADSVLQTIKNHSKTTEQKIIYCFLNDNINRAFSSNQLLKKLSHSQIHTLSPLHRSILLGTSSLNHANNWDAPKMYASAQKAIKYATPINKIKSIYELLPYSALCFAQFAIEKYGDAAQTVYDIYPNIKAKNFNCSQTKRDAYNAMGLATTDFGHQKLSIELQESNLNCLLSSKNTSKGSLYSTYNNLGQTHILYGDYQKAMEYQLKAKEVGDKYFKSQYSYEWFWHMGWLNYSLGNYDLFKHYTQKAHDMIVEKFGKNHMDYILINKVFVAGYLKFGDYKNARERLLMAQDALKNNFKTHSETYIFLEIQLGKIDLLEKKYKKAIQHLKKAHNFLKNKPFYYEHKIEVDFHLAKAYYHLKNKEEANKILKNCFENLSKTESWSAKNRKIKAQLLYLRINKEKTQTQDYENLINQINTDFLNQNSLLSVYEEYCYFLLSKNRLNQANTIAKKGLDLLNTSNSMLGDMNHPVSNESKKMIEVAQLVYLKNYLKTPTPTNLNTLFKSTEYKKANELQSVFYQKKLKSIAYIPDSIFRREQFLKNRMNVLKDEIKSAEKSGKSTHFLLKSLTEVNRNYTKFVQKYKEKYPRYFGIMFPKISELTEVQEKLGNKQCILSFTRIKNEYYAIFISKTNAQLFKLPNADYSSEITKLNLAAKNNDIKIYKETAYNLYNRIFKPIESVLLPNVIYIPTQELAYLNPEMLIANRTGKQFKELSYLLKQYNFSRNYSINLMIHGSDNKTNTKSKMLAFAPIFDSEMKKEYLKNFREHKIDSQYLYLLKQPFAKKMLKEIPSRYKIKKYMGSLAKEATFKQHSKNYNILHFSTHTLLNAAEPMNSKIYFAKTDSNEREDGDLHLHEIYAMSLNNDLTVLSTCDAAKSNFTNVGNEFISLTHSFAYAGSKNLIYTLWSIDEQQSQIILGDFYDYFKANSSFSKKLRKAKLQYLTTTTPQLASPYYWGGIVIQSGFETDKATSFHWIFWVLGALVLFLIWFFYRQKLNKNRPFL